MLWTHQQQFHTWPFDKEADLEAAIAQVKTTLFGESRVYLELKKLIGEKGKTQNIPDGYLLDFSSPTKPVLYLVEVELAKHDPLRHIAQQLLNFSLSFKSTPQRMKSILREALQKSPEPPEIPSALSICETYATKNGFSNIDYLLERMIYPENAFNALLIIDDLEDELESIVRSSLRFPVETLTVARFRSPAGEAVYQFDPFLYDLSKQSATVSAETGNTPAIDPSEVDTIVVPAREDGFKETFLGKTCGGRFASIRACSRRSNTWRPTKWHRFLQLRTSLRWTTSNHGRKRVNTPSTSRVPLRRSGRCRSFQAAR